MLCHECNKRTATVHLTEVVANKKHEIHLCETCAQSKGIAIKAKIEGLDVPEFVAKTMEEPASPGTDEDHASVSCSGCNLSFAAFRKAGKMGCRKCYETFEREIASLLNRIHGQCHHRGKTPTRGGGARPTQDEIKNLRAELKTAVTAEDYERAALIRDRLRRIERKPSDSL